MASSSQAHRLPSPAGLPPPGGYTGSSGKHAPPSPSDHAHAQSPSPSPLPAPADHGHAPAPALVGKPKMQVAMVWRGQILRYELLRHARRVTVGPSKRALLITPPVTGRSRFVLARPRSGGYLLQLAPGMHGDV